MKRLNTKIACDSDNFSHRIQSACNKLKEKSAEAYNANEKLQEINNKLITANNQLKDSGKRLRVTEAALTRCQQVTMIII